ncbi:sodium-dependent transporter [Estrella lausannensis]|uniref:Sodium-dependent transporter n=1 Tax=Estrella lausannensis TaxID=483423 RepID=A0A0H5E5Y9_9BACT|nr:sodium-dependent transporter [Estrella lausannensis]CRX38650.1 Sodium-dependent transporter [Estrella lausannensis]
MQRESWGSKLGFIMAVAGSAIGLANIWRFPYLVGKFGGAAFIMVYILFLFLIGFPVLISEITLGRRAQSSPSGAFKMIGGKGWAYAGKLTILTGFLVASFYSVVAGWVLGYLVEALFGQMNHFTSNESSLAHFTTLISTPWWTVLFLSLFLVLCTSVLYLGVQQGIERGNKILMPVLFLTLIFLVVRGLFMPNAKEAIAFLLSPDWSILTGEGILAALGQAFFTLSLGQGTMVTYGSYLQKKENILTTCIPVVSMDFAVSILSAIAVFTIAFSVGIEPDSGPSLVFHTLPWVFSQLTGGYLIALIFFLLVFLAALTSEISAMEPSIAYLRDEFGWSRHLATVVVAAGALLLGIPSALSYSLLKDTTFFGKPFLEFMEFLCGNILIPLGGLLAVGSVAYLWGVKGALEEIETGDGGLIKRNKWIGVYLSVCFRYVAPLFIIFVFLNALGIFG